MKAGFLHKLFDKLDRIGPEEVQNYVGRVLKEMGFLERVFDALQEGVIVLDVEGVITYVNRSACGLFGLREDEAVGASLGREIPGLEWEPLVREGRVINRDLELFYPENRYLNFYLAPIHGGDLVPIGEKEVTVEEAGELLGYVMIVRDITREREVEEEKIESERLSALTMLAAGVAHEIGNPLNSLNIHLQLIQRKLAKAPPEVRESVDELLEISQGEIKRLDFIVEQFLGAIRPTKPDLGPTDVNELVLEAGRFLEPELEDRQVRLEFDLANNLPEMRLDRDQFKQVFYNLMKNASQAIGKEGVIKISTSADDYNFFIRFEDDGVGIGADDMSRIFEPYFTTKRTGTGLGLLIVRRIIREHGGELEFESAEGQGTRVTIFLPRAEKPVRFLPPAGESQATAAAEAETDQGGGAKKAKGKVVE